MNVDPRAAAVLVRDSVKMHGMAEKNSGLMRGLALALIPPAAIGLFTFLFPGNAAATWVVASAKAIWSLAWDIAAYIGHALIFPVPLWTALVLLALAVWGWSGRVRTVAERARAASPAKAECDLLEMLFVADGQWVSLEAVAKALNWRRLFVESVAERLAGRGFLADTFVVSSSAQLRLSSRGRDYAMNNNLLGSQAMHEQLTAAVNELSWRV